MDADAYAAPGDSRIAGFLVAAGLAFGSSALAWFGICAAEGAVPALVVGLPFALLPGLTQVLWVPALAWSQRQNQRQATASGLWRGAAAALAVNAVGLAILVAAAVIGWMNLPPGKLV